MTMIHLTTALKGKNVSWADQVADFCLNPVHYLWEGRKVEIIERGELSAYIVDSAYREKDHHFLMTALMVILLIPGLCVGGIFKAIAVSFHHTQDQDFIMGRVLATWEKTEERLKPMKVFDGGKSREFCTQIRALQEALKKVVSDEKDGPLFLSEVQEIELPFDSQELNHTILKNLDLLWNLKLLHLNNHQCSAEEKALLKKMDPLVTSKGKSADCLQAMTVQQYLSRPILV